MGKRNPDLCDVCGKTPEDFNGRKQYNEHFRKKDHVDSLIECSQCDKSFPNKTRLTVHEKRTHDNEQFNCIHCNKLFNRKDLLKKHMKIHESSGGVSCLLCKKNFY